MSSLKDAGLKLILKTSLKTKEKGSWKVTDALKIIIMALMMIVALIIGAAPMARYLSKSLDVTIQDSVGIIVLILNFLAIVVMIITIYANNKSSADQINTIKNATSAQIDAIKAATQNHINLLEEFERKSRDTLLCALILEYKENLHQMKYILEHEKEWCDLKNTKAPMSIFSCEAYQANLNRGTIDDVSWIDVLVRVYTSFKLYQSYVDAVKNNIADGNFTAKVDNLNTLMEHIRHNLDDTVRFQEVIIEYKNTHCKK